MPAPILVLLTFLLKQPDGRIVPSDLAHVRDMQTCATMAEMLNAVVKTDPSALFICREVSAPPAKS